MADAGGAVMNGGKFWDGESFRELHEIVAGQASHAFLHDSSSSYGEHGLGVEHATRLSVDPLPRSS